MDLRRKHYAALAAEPKEKGGQQAVIDDGSSDHETAHSMSKQEGNLARRERLVRAEAAGRGATKGGRP